MELNVFGLSNFVVLYLIHFQGVDEVFVVFLGFSGLMLILAGVTKYFPAKKANHLYGYRTSRSMRNRKNWDYAQSLLPGMFLRIAMYFLVASIAWYLSPGYGERNGMIAFLVLLFVTFGFEIYRSEKKLKRFSRRNR